MRKYQRLVFIGFRGTGKSTIAKILADQIGWQYISTDRLIEQASRVKISQLVNQQGWPGFRRIEKQVIRGLKEQMEIVIDCGGGVVEDEENLQNLESGSLIIWLDATLTDIYNRIASEAGERPMLSHTDLRQDIEFNYSRRLPKYQKFGKLRLSSSEKTVAEICQFILKEIEFAS
jgi:shikimate kinase